MQPAIKKTTAAANMNKAPVQTWFGEGKVEETGDFDDDDAEVIPHQAHNKKEHSGAKNAASAGGKMNQEIPIDDDWDLDEEQQNAVGYIKMPQRGKPVQAFNQPPASSYGMRPATAVPGPKSTAQRSGTI